MRKSFLVKFLIVTMVLGFATVGILDVGSVKASTPLEPNRSLFTPEFTVTLEAHPYFESPKYRLDPFTGEWETIHNGYHVENRSIVVRIKNTPFTPYYTKIGGSLVELYYNVRAKGHFEGSWTSLRQIFVSDSEYSTKYYAIGEDADTIPFRRLSVGDIVDIQVQESLGIYYIGGFISQWGDASTRYPSSDFSETQTVTISELQTPSPSSEPFPIILAVASIAIIGIIGISILVYFKKIKRK